MPNTPNPLIGFGFLMTAIDLRSLFSWFHAPTAASQPDQTKD